jgi:hypothetical protein
VIHRHVLAALATGIEAGNDDAARAALARTEWLVRGAARRRFERALIDAALSTGELVSGADPEAMRHVQRVAALDLAGRDVNACDREAVSRAYRGLDVRAPTAPLATIVAGAVVALAAIAFVLGVYRLRHPRHERPDLPAVAGAFRTGGVPAYDAAVEKVLAEDMPIAAWHGDATPALRHALDGRDPELVAAWTKFLDAFDRLDRKHPGKLRDAAHVLSNHLAAQGLGYHVEGYVQDARAIVFVYRVERVVFVRADGEPRRVLDLRRIDRINLERFVLGLESDEMSDPLVMIDRVEEFVATHVKPLVWGAPYELGDATFRHSVAGAQLATAAGIAIRAEIQEPLVDRVAASVRRHEARHSIDIERDLDIHMPAALARYVGDGGPFANKAKAELAAYLTQIAYDPAMPQLALWNLANQAFDHDYSSGAEAYAAVVALEGLARHAGGGIRPPAMVGGRLDRGRLAETALPLTGISDDALRVAARELFAELFEERPVAIYDNLLDFRP